MKLLCDAGQALSGQGLCHRLSGQGLEEAPGQGDLSRQILEEPVRQFDHRTHSLDSRCLSEAADSPWSIGKDVELEGLRCLGWS